MEGQSGGEGTRRDKEEEEGKEEEEEEEDETEKEKKKKKKKKTAEKAKEAIFIPGIGLPVLYCSESKNLKHFNSSGLAKKCLPLFGEQEVRYAASPFCVCFAVCVCVFFSIDQKYFNEKLTSNKILLLLFSNLFWNL